MLRLVVVAEVTYVACTGTPTGGHPPCRAGACSVTCANGVTCTVPSGGFAVCADGGCSAACNDPNRTICDNVCVDLTSSWSNCGGCGVGCSSGERCINSNCVCTDPVRCQE